MTNAGQTMEDVLTTAQTPKVHTSALVGLVMHSTLMERHAEVSEALGLINTAFIQRY